jgi:GTPase SAR1 family protein
MFIIEVNLIGLDGSGKRTFINRVKTGEYKHHKEDYSSDEIVLNSNYGKIKYIIYYDCDHITTDIKWLMIDLTRDTPVSIFKEDNYANIMIFSKCDEIYGLEKVPRIPNTKSFSISAKTNYNIPEPFLETGKMLLGSNFKFKECAPILPKEVEINLN